MPSPFPGMNPFLENSDVWQDFHDSMIPAIRDVLASLVSADFVVKIEEHLYIHKRSTTPRPRILMKPIDVPQRICNTETTKLESPAWAMLPPIEFEQYRFLEIRDRATKELITILEMISPLTKQPSSGREQYLGFRGKHLHGAANFVEIDLIRSWERMPIVEVIECDYAIMVSRAIDRPRVNYWPLSLRDPLPAIPIPLRPPFDPVQLDLQSIIHEVYDRAKYKTYIYEETPEPPLNPADAAWAQSLIAAHV